MDKALANGPDRVPPVPAAVCDGGDLDCGNGLLLIIRKAMEPLLPGQVLEIRSREISVRDDLPAWCRMVKHDFLGDFSGDGFRRYFVRKGGKPEAIQPDAPGAEDSLETDLAKAKNFRWSLRVRQTAPGQCSVYARSHVFPVGQPIDFSFGAGGGGRTSADGIGSPLSAVEYLLASLGACLAAGYQVHASRAGVAIDQLEVAVRGQLGNPLIFLGLDDEGSPGFSEASATLYVNADADEALLAEVWATTVARSPIVNTLKGTVALDLNLQVVL